MVALDAAQVLSIPRTIKANEVVKRGFMSNFLFANIAGIFRAPQAALDILDNLDYVAQGKITKAKDNAPIDTQGIEVDEAGQVMVENEIIINRSAAIFGEKQFESSVIDSILEETLDEEGVTSQPALNRLAKNIGQTVVEGMKPQLQTLKNDYEMTTTALNRVEKQMEAKIQTTVAKANAEFLIAKAHLENKQQENLAKATTEEMRQTVEADFHEQVAQATQTYTQEIHKQVDEMIAIAQKDIIEEQERKKITRNKNQVEEEIRGRLRYFARAIPSFIMAYGDASLTLANFEEYTPADVFLEVTKITVEQFLFLRDGGDYEENGETRHFKGQLFDEVVFNESVQEFLRKKAALADYFEEQTEDIFDYIPPQKTNQIYTPKWVVKKMVDDLERENPGIYDDSSKTFADLYMKSGLYITEIVKKLYNSPVIQQEFPDRNQRIKHILENQVYGFAPTEIIYKIAMNFIFGKVDSNVHRTNFVQEDTVPYAKAGTLSKLVDHYFGKAEER